MAQEAETTPSNGQSAALAAREPERGIQAFADEKSFEVAQRIGKAMTQASLVPEAYRGAQGLPNVLIAMELAHRIGASPLMVMQNLHVVQGRPSWSSQFLIATVNSSQRFTPLRFRWVGTPGKDDWGCRCVARDRDTDDACEGTLITWAMAKAEGWTSKKGSKWQTMPEQMFMYRAAAFWTRVYAPELSLGMHTSEELTDSALGGMPHVQMAEVPAAITPGDTRALEASLRGEVEVDPETGEVIPPAREPGED